MLRLGFRDEAVAVPRDGFDIRTIASQHTPQIGDMAAKRGFLHRRVRPEDVQQLLPGAQFAWFFRKQGEQVEGFRRNGDARARAPQGSLRGVQLKLPEFYGPYCFQ